MMALTWSYCRRSFCGLVHSFLAPGASFFSKAMERLYGEYFAAFVLGAWRERDYEAL